MDREGRLLGATIFLTEEEVQQLRNGESVEITSP